MYGLSNINANTFSSAESIEITKTDSEELLRDFGLYILVEMIKSDNNMME